MSTSAGLAMGGPEGFAAGRGRMWRRRLETGAGTGPLPCGPDRAASDEPLVLVRGAAQRDARALWRPGRAALKTYTYPCLAYRNMNSQESDGNLEFYND